MASLNELLDRLDPDENKRGRQFEQICQWFLTHDPRYRRELEKVWLWDEWPGRWGADAGIDLVAKHQDGSLWAIQAKAYHPDYNIKKADVDTFLRGFEYLEKYAKGHGTANVPFKYRAEDGYRLGVWVNTQRST